MRNFNIKYDVVFISSKLENTIAIEMGAANDFINNINIVVNEDTNDDDEYSVIMDVDYVSNENMDDVLFDTFKNIICKYDGAQ